MKEITIEKIFDNEDNQMAYACTGENVKIVIKGAEKDDIQRGQVICGLQYWVNVC